VAVVAYTDRERTSTAKRVEELTCVIVSGDNGCSPNAVAHTGVIRTELLDGDCDLRRLSQLSIGHIIIACDNRHRIGRVHCDAEQMLHDWRDLGLNDDGDRVPQLMKHFRQHRSTNGTISLTDRHVSGNLHPGEYDGGRPGATKDLVS